MESRVLVTARKVSELGAKTEKTLAEPPVIDARPRELTSASPGLKELAG